MPLKNCYLPFLQQFVTANILQECHKMAPFLSESPTEISQRSRHHMPWIPFPPPE